MKLIIPSYNRPLKLERSLVFYKSVLCDGQHDIVVLDGSDDGASAEKIRILCKSLGVGYFFHLAPFTERMIAYCRSIAPDEIVALGPDEDVYLPEFLGIAEAFLRTNQDYSAIIGRYATFAKPIGPLHRVPYCADTILDHEINDEDPIVRSSDFVSCLLAGCPPLFWGVRSASNYIESCELQGQCLSGGSMEAIDQAVVCQQGKIKIVPDLMFLRDETKIGHEHRANHHDAIHYITSEECERLLEVASNSRFGTLAVSIKFWISLYRYSENSPVSMAIQWGGNNLQRQTPYSGGRIELWLVGTRFFFIRVVTVFFEILTAMNLTNMLKAKYGRATISKVLKKIPLAV